MNKSESIAAIAKALAAAQADIVNPPRDREVTVQTKGGSAYKFKYATLSAILDAVRGPLTKNGLWFTQTLANSDGKYRLITTLMHASGEWLDSEQPLFVTDQTNQAFGSALTYAKRYALTGMLGVAADEDDDANAADGNKVTASKARAPDAPHASQKQADLDYWRTYVDNLAESISVQPDARFLADLWVEETPELTKLKAFSAKAYAGVVERFQKRGLKEAA